MNSGKKAIFITGAASGIGRATANLFASRGCFVGLYDRNAEPLEAVYKEIGEGNGCRQVMDVTNESSIDSAFNHFAAASSGRIEVLFNCAGIMEVGNFEEVPMELHKRVFDINVNGVMACTHRALPLLKATSGSHVISMCSASAVYGTPDLASYSASKFAVRGFTEAMNLEWRKFGVTVCDIMAPFVNTPMVRNAKHSVSMDRVGVKLTPEMVAETVWKAAHGRRVHWPVGGEFTFLYWMSGAFLSPTNRWFMRHYSGY